MTARSAVIRRRPVPSGVEDEFVDPDLALGFVFVATGRPDEFRIKGSDIVVTWDRKDQRWLTAEGLVINFQSMPGPRPAPSTRTLPAKASKQWQHFTLTMEDFKGLGLLDQMNMLAELADSFGVTPIELFWQQQPQESPARFYRYHKFPLDPRKQTLVLGGGINKSEIDDDMMANNLKALIKTRYDLLMQVSSDSVKKQVLAMQKFQASAMTTPFIATTTNRKYAEQLFAEYPPTSTQKAVILVIDGPRSHAFDFEAHFDALGVQAGGKAEWNWRTTAQRSKDANQAEFGLPDLYIPLRGVSHSGFRIVDVIELGIPISSGLLTSLSHDSQLHVERSPSTIGQQTINQNDGGSGGSKTGNTDEPQSD